MFYMISGYTYKCRVIFWT